ncbi:predicted protein [Staphylococcus aureus subsp. aureus EMRSA16]|nr:predicted protein [Staphylococcus aureus subsp. aureus EMRSA16]EFH95848.1 putative phospholipase C [Staphylococcus aureus subsp. aureus MN8]EHT82602.1 phospholipase C [Staphylococcus aureus subsp. aureus CIGC341D]
MSLQPSFLKSDYICQLYLQHLYTQKTFTQKYKFDLIINLNLVNQFCIYFVVSYIKGVIMMVKKTKSNTLKKDATLALANLLLIGALTDNSAKAESKKDDTDLKLVSHNVYMLSTVLYPNWRLLT